MALTDEEIRSFSPYEKDLLFSMMQKGGSFIARKSVSDVSVKVNGV